MHYETLMSEFINSDIIRANERVSAIMLMNTATKTCENTNKLWAQLHFIIE